MISRRARRSTSPQEQLKQFALNFSKGVDATKAPTDLSTALSAKNLKVNLDGSLSLRNPVTLKDYEPDCKGFRYLYDMKSKLCWGDNYFYIVSDKGDASKNIYTLTTHSGARIERTIADLKNEDVFKFDNAPEIINLNTATLVGGVYVRLSFFDGSSVTVLNPDLYDDPSEYFPRYLKIRYDSGKDIWVIEIVTPEPNLISNAEGDFALNPNLTLDNPYATRDSYDNSVPSVKGILAYTMFESPDDVLAEVPGAYDYTVLTVDLPLGSAASNSTTLFRTDSLPSLEPNRSVNAVLGGTYQCDVIYGTDDDPFYCKVDFQGFTECEVALDPDHAKYGLACVELECLIRFGVVQRTASGALERIPTGHSVRHTDYIRFNNAKRVRLSSAQDSTTRYSATDIVSGYADVHVMATLKAFELSAFPKSVAELTESAKSRRYAPVSSFKNNSVPLAFLKAFCRLPFKFETPVFYAAWSQSSDGIDWTPVDAYDRGINVRELNPNWKPISKDDQPTSSDYTTRKYYPILASSELDDIYTTDRATLNRIDVLEVPYGRTYMDATMYKFTIVTVEQIFSGDVEYSDELFGDQYRVSATVSEASYTPSISSKTELATLDLGNAVLGNKLYHKKSIYSYGHESFKNNILVSDTDSFITPLYNIIDVDAVNAANVTCVLPWRDYLVSATENAVYLHSKQGDGYYTKTVNTSVGIPSFDSKCCKAILNGIIFKSGSKLYQLIPNVYSGDDSTLNVNVISNPIEDYLESYSMHDTAPFAISTDSEYILMLPEEHGTKCLRYTYNSKMWTISEYPILFDSYWVKDLEHVYLFGKTDAGHPGMWQLDSDSPNPFDENLKTSTPISFELDTGQKTDGISLQKQFVESKLMFATEDDAEAFPMQLIVAVDGDPHITTVDVNTDAPFWKSGTSSVGVLGTSFRLSNEESLGRASSGILRQLIVRYSGKGRSVRHILTGSPTSNFKLYETYVRYKTLNVKK